MVEENNAISGELAKLSKAMADVKGNTEKMGAKLRKAVDNLPNILTKKGEKGNTEGMGQFEKFISKMKMSKIGGHKQKLYIL